MYIIILQIISLIMISYLFIDSGIDKIIAFGKRVNGLNKKMIFNHLPRFISELAMVIAILLELISPFLILYGIITYDKTYIIMGLIGLMIFTILATIFYHVNPFEKYEFLKNLSIIGCMAYIIITLMRTNSA